MRHSLIALSTAVLVTACSGDDISLSLNGPGININTHHYGSNNPNRHGHFTPPANSNRNSAVPGNERWRHLNGISTTTNRIDSDGVQRYFPNTTDCRDCATIPAADRNNLYYLANGLGTHREISYGGANLLYRNLSYASFGSYHAVGDRYRHFHISQPTPYTAVPTSGSARYSGSVIYRDAEDGHIELNLDFANKNVSGSINGLSATANRKLDISATLAGNSISGNVHYNDRSLENTVPYSGGILDATLAGPGAEHIIGQFSLPAAKHRHSHPENTAVFGAEKQ